MVGELITLPLRLTGAAARFWWRAADQALGLASGVAGHVIERVSPTPERESPTVSPGRETGGSTAPSPARDAGPGTGARGAPAVRPARTAPPVAPEPPPATPIEEPAHVSEEPELVEEVAEPGAEDGAGAELHIREPWEGYRDMSAREIGARLVGASTAELAAVQLYESANRSRQTILSAVARQLKGQPQSGASQMTGANGGGTQR
jgi:hypothetical protein